MTTTATQIDPVRAHWREMSEHGRANPDQTPEQLRERIEKRWPALTREPGDVDYLEDKVGGLPVLWAVPHARTGDAVILAFHGGGGVSGSIYTHRKLFGHLAKAVGARALIAGYREAPFPAPVDDALTTYRWLLDKGVDPTRIALAGDSFGGGLALSVILQSRDAGLPMASAVMLMSPWIDLAVSSETFDTNQESEEFFYQPVVEALAGLYLNGTDPKHPLASPLYADLTGLPPINIQVGGDETLLGESQRFEEAAHAAGVEVTLTVFRDQLHTFQMAAGHTQEADAAIRQLAEWVKPRLGLATAG